MFLVFFMLVGTLTIGAAVIKAIDLYGRGLRARRQHIRWWDDFHADARNVVDAHAYLAAAEQRLADRIASMPSEYAERARAVLAQSETFRRLHATTADDAARIASAAPAEAAPASGDRTMPSMVWIGGQLVAAPKEAA